MSINFGKFARFVAKYRGAIYSFLLFVFIGLSFLNNYFNFTRKTSEILDAAPVLTTKSDLSALPLIDAKKTELINTSYVASTPSTSTRYVFSNNSNSNQPTLFTISRVENVSDPSIDAGNGIKRYNYNGKNRFLYAHSTRAFAPIKHIYAGGRFTATLDGVTKTYRVERREVFAKSDLDSNASLRASIYSASYRGKTYDLSLMTCGNGTNDDSNYRLVLFAVTE